MTVTLRRDDSMLRVPGRAYLVFVDGEPRGAVVAMESSRGTCWDAMRPTPSRSQPWATRGLWLRSRAEAVASVVRRSEKATAS